jgi:hypothetical protein
MPMMLRGLMVTIWLSLPAVAVGAQDLDTQQSNKPSKPGRTTSSRCGLQNAKQA